MWGRFEAIENNRIAALGKMTAIFFLLLSPICAEAQTLPDGITQMLELEAENGGKDLDEMVAYYESLMERPLNINKASREELSRLSILSDFQIESIIEYREGYGEILSVSELSLVDGFNAAKVSALLPFITFGPNPNPHKKMKDRVLQKIILRTKRTYLARDTVGIPYYLYSKYKMEYGEKLQVGFTLENDAFESCWPDFYSLYVQAKNLPLSPRRNVRLISAVIGDFSARMGQGLVLWNSFSISGLSDPSSIFKKESEVIPYTSSDEQNFFRGAGATVLFGDYLKASLLYSANLRDARVDKKYYYSLPSGGIHVSKSEIDARKTLLEHLGGANISFEKENFKVGVSASFFTFDKENRRRTIDYNGWWGNISMDGYYLYRGYRLFAEGAVDMGGSLAGIVGSILPISAKLDLSLLLRSYSKGYVAPHAGAYSSSSKRAGETGLLLSVKWMFGGSFTYRGALELVKADANKLKVRSQLDYDAGGGHSMYVRASYNLYSGPEQKFSARLAYSWKGHSGFFVGAKAEASVPYGVAVSAEGGYKSISGRWNICLSGCVYHVDNWDGRIYFYEKDLPQTFSVPALYGRGCTIYGFIHFRALKWMNLYLKISNKTAKGEITLTF